MQRVLDGAEGNERVRGVEVGMVDHGVDRAEEQDAAERDESDASDVGHRREW